jgi:hypothetical protein
MMKLFEEVLKEADYGDEYFDDDFKLGENEVEVTVCRKPDTLKEVYEVLGQGSTVITVNHTVEASTEFFDSLKKSKNLCGMEVDGTKDWWKFVDIGGKYPPIYIDTDFGETLRFVAMDVEDDQAWAKIFKRRN